MSGGTGVAPGWRFRGGTLGVVQGFGVTLHGITWLCMEYFGGGSAIIWGGGHLPGVLGGQSRSYPHPIQPNLPQLAQGVAKTLK